MPPKTFEKPDPNAGKLVLTQQKNGDMGKLIGYNPELFRLKMVHDLLVGTVPPSRIKREQMFFEGLIKGTEKKGIKLPGLMELTETMRILSRDEEGMREDAIIKVLSPVPQFGNLGTPYPEPEPGLLTKMWWFIAGAPSEASRK